MDERPAQDVPVEGGTPPPVVEHAHHARGRQSAKLDVPALSVDESCRLFETRRARLLDAFIAGAGSDPHAERAIAHLVIGRGEHEANERIRTAAEWFDH